MDTTELFDLYFSDNINTMIYDIIDENNISYNYLVTTDNHINFYNFLKQNIDQESSVYLYEEEHLINVNYDSEESSDEF
jgi:hypothetical protein